MQKFFNNFELKSFFTPKVTSASGEIIIQKSLKKKNEIDLLELTRTMERYLSHTSYKVSNYKEQCLEHLKNDFIKDISITYNQYGDSFPVLTFVNKLRRNVLTVFTQIQEGEVLLLDTFWYSEFSGDPSYSNLEDEINKNFKLLSKYIVWNHLQTYAEDMLEAKNLPISNSNLARVTLTGGALSFEFNSPYSSVNFVYLEGDYSFSNLKNTSCAYSEKISKKLIKNSYVKKENIYSPLLSYLLTLSRPRIISKANVKKLISIYTAQSEAYNLL